jgi:hypothetical protein
LETLEKRKRKGKKTHLKKLKLFSPSTLPPLTSSQGSSPHILIAWCLLVVTTDSCVHLHIPLVPAAEYRTGPPALAADTALANQRSCQKQLSINGVCGNNQELFENARW